MLTLTEQSGVTLDVCIDGAAILRDGEMVRISELIAILNEYEKALEWFANPDIYKTNPHGIAFDRPDMSWRARSALSRARGETSPPTGS